MRPLLLAMVLSGLSPAVFPQVTVADAWLRATVPGQQVGGAYMTLTSAKDAKLVEVRSAAARMTELHEMAMSGGVMSMRHVPELALPAGRTVDLKPGGLHVMLMGLKAPVKEGDKVPMTLVVEGADGKRSTVEVIASARAAGAR